MKSLASCTVQTRLSCMLHTMAINDFFQVADLPGAASAGLLACGLRRLSEGAASGTRYPARSVANPQEVV